MGLPVGLRYAVDEERLNYIIKVAPDELAPQLSRVVRELLHNEAEHITRVAKLFVKTTVLTDTFKTILGGVFSALSRNGEFTKWLNLDMGSGKTHLLTLITYLLYAYEAFEEIEDYRKLGLSSEIAKKTALLVIDMRTPSEIPTTFFPFFAKSLEKVGESDAANYVRSRVERGEIPTAAELTKKLRRDTRIVVIIDELHHAILTYRGTLEERKWIRETIDFVVQLIDYLRHYDRGFVILVASARRDYARVLQLGSSDELITAAENLLSQLGRLESILETKWLSVDEAKRIILSKIGAKQDIFHPIFDRFIERVIKAESDIPQAQHLRSLIKAMAVYTRNAIDLGHSIVTPASFSEGVLDALFPEGGGIAESYKSAYSKIVSDIKSLEGVAEETKEVAKLIANVVFSMSVSGRMDQLLETIKAYKFGTYRLELLPAVFEQDIKRVLDDLGIGDPRTISDAFNVLSGIPYVHSVRIHGAYAYFVVPVENVSAIFRRLIEDRYKQNLADREGLVNELIGYLHTVSGRTDDYGRIVVVSDYSGLEEVTKGLDPNVMHVVIYADLDLVKYLEETLRKSASINIDETIRGWFKKRGLKDLAEWLKEHHKQNLAIVVPVLTDEVLRGVARSKAVIEATSRVVNEYLMKYADGKLSEELRKIVEIEQEEIHRAIGGAYTEALKMFVNSCLLALSRVYIYKRSYTPPYGIVDHVSLEEVKVSKAVKRVISVDSRWYSKLVEMMEEIRNDEIRDVAVELVKAVRKYAGFVDDYYVARDIIMNYVVEELRKGGQRGVEVRKDMNTYIYSSGVVYIPPATVEKAVHAISKDELKKLLGRDVEIEELRPSGIVVRITAGGLPQQQSTQTQQLILKPLDEFSRTEEMVKSLSRGFISIVIEFDQSSRGTVLSLLQILKKYRNYIKKIEARAS